jgi:hypothetical protein
MSKFNTTAKGKNSTPTGENLAGGVSFDRDLKSEVASVVLSSMLNGDQYYMTAEEKMSYIDQLASECAKNEDTAVFFAKAMVYARNEGFLRSVSHLMAVNLVENVKGKEFVKPALIKTFIRPDDMTETVALWNSRHPDVMVPNSIQRACKTCLETKWDRFQLKKYEGKSKKVKLRDIVKLSHPKDPNGAFKQLIEGTLPKIDTIERNVAAGESASESMSKLLRENRLPYMAAVKNIRNALESGLSKDDVLKFCELIVNDKLRAKSKIMPFRFWDAYRQVEISSGIDRFTKEHVKEALEIAFIAATKDLNILKEGERIALCLDESGSMGRMYDNKSPFYHGAILTCAIHASVGAKNSIVYGWDTGCREISMIANSPFATLSGMEANSGGTSVEAPLQKMIQDKVYVDKILIFTDEQFLSARGCKNKKFDSVLNEYKSKINKDVQVIFWNLAGYSGGAPYNTFNGNISEISGYSDRILSVLGNLWGDKSALVREIEKVEL